MRQMNTREFAEEFSDRKGRYVFSYLDQSCETIDNFTRLKLNFDSIKVACNPNAIMLRGNGNMMCIDGVRRITVSDDATMNGQVFEITCGYGGNYEKVYKILSLA